MISASSDVTLPVAADEAFAEATALDRADWLPAVRRVHRIPGSPDGVGSRYEVEVGFIGRHLRGVLVCRRFDPPTGALYELEEGMELAIRIDVIPIGGGCRMRLTAEYSVAGGPFVGGAVERASAGPARREVARALEQLSSRFRRSVR